MTRRKVEGLVKCPDCFGKGSIETPATHWGRFEKCGTCEGKGYVPKKTEIRVQGSLPVDPKDVLWGDAPDPYRYEGER